MRKIIALLFSVMLIAYALPCSAGELVQRGELTQRPLLQKDYLSNNELGVDLLRNLHAYWSMDEPTWDNSTGQVRDNLSGSRYINIAYPSEDMTPGTGVWSNAGDVSATVTATTIEDNSVVETQFFRTESFGTPGLAFWTVCVDIKKETTPGYYPAINWRFAGGTVVQSGVVVDTANGTLTTATLASSEAPQATSIKSITVEGVEYWRVQLMHYDSAGNNTVARVDIRPAFNTNAGAVQEISAQGVTTATRWQIYKSSNLGIPYIKTTTSAVESIGNHGTPYNNITTTLGKLGNAGNFIAASNQYINAGSLAGDFTDTFTIAGWVNTSSTGRVITRRYSGGTQYDYYVDTDAVVLNDGSTLHSSTATSILDGNWHHIAVVIDGSSSKHYFDGIQVGNTFNPSISSQSGDTIIGAWLNAGTPTNEFDGQIDEVTIWNRVLSPDEVKQLDNDGRGRYIE